MNISILDGRSYFYQWETDRVLVFDGVADGTEIHVNRGTECYRYYVADGQVAIDDFLLRECLPLRVYVIEDGAVTFEKAFKIVWKPRPDDYVDTPEEKQAWDEMSKRIDELSEQGGGAFYVTLTQDPTTLEYSSDKSYDEVKVAYGDNRNIMCRVSLEELIDVELSLFAHIEDEKCFIFIATDGEASYMAELSNVDGNTIAFFYETEETNEPLTLSIGGRTVVYDGKKPETIIVQSLKNPYSLTINGTSYDGSKAVTIEAADGKSAYAYAQDGGYTGTEEEFAEKMASGSLQVTFTFSSEADGILYFTADKSVAECISAFKKGTSVYGMHDYVGAGYTGLMTSYSEEYTQVVFQLFSPLTKSHLIIAGYADEWQGFYLSSPTKEQGVYYIEGTGSTAGTWLGSHDDITEYYPGLTVLYKVPVAGASGGTTLNINDLGAATVVRNATTGISTTCPVNSVVMLTYTEDSGTAYWKTADYDSNTKTTTGTSNKAGTKLYLAGATSQSSSGATTYSNTNCYIGTNNRLYSGGAVVPNVDEINALISTALDAIGVAEEGAY